MQCTCMGQPDARVCTCMGVEDEQDEHRPAGARPDDPDEAEGDLRACVQGTRVGPRDARAHACTGCTFEHAIHITMHGEYVHTVACCRHEKAPTGWRSQIVGRCGT